MNDFLHKLRKGQDYKRTGNDSRYIKRSRHYEGNKNGSHDYRNTKSHAESTRKKSFISEESIIGITEIIEDIKTSHKRLADAEERRARADERMADALESMVHTASLLMGVNGIKSADPDQVPNSSTKEIAAAVKMKNLVKTATEVDRDKVIEIIAEMRSEDKTYKEIAIYLEKLQLPTFSGRGKWHAQTVHRLCRQACL